MPFTSHLLPQENENISQTKLTVTHYFISSLNFSNDIPIPTPVTWPDVRNYRNSRIEITSEIM